MISPLPALSRNRSGSAAGAESIATRGQERAPSIGARALDAVQSRTPTVGRLPSRDRLGFIGVLAERRVDHFRHREDC